MVSNQKPVHSAVPQCKPALWIPVVNQSTACVCKLPCDVTTDCVPCMVPDVALQLTCMPTKQLVSFQASMQAKHHAAQVHGHDCLGTLPSLQAPSMSFTIIMVAMVTPKTECSCVYQCSCTSTTWTSSTPYSFDTSFPSPPLSTFLSLSLPHPLSTSANASPLHAGTCQKELMQSFLVSSNTHGQTTVQHACMYIECGVDKHTQHYSIAALLPSQQTMPTVQSLH